MDYRVEMHRKARQNLRRLPSDIRARVDRALARLSVGPYPRRASRLQEEERRLRVRVGDYRIVYEVDESRRVVDVHDVDHRKDVYWGR